MQMGSLWVLAASSAVFAEHGQTKYGLHNVFADTVLLLHSIIDAKIFSRQCRPTFLLLRVQSCVLACWQGLAVSIWHPESESFIIDISEFYKFLRHR